MGEWRKVRLGEVTRSFDFRRAPVKAQDRVSGPYPYYGASGVVDHVDNYLFDGEYLLVAEDGENLRTRKTPIAFMASGKFWVNNHAHVLQGDETVDSRFLSYLLANMDISGYLSGSTQPKLTQAALNSIQLVVPDRRTQDAATDLLRALDGKIALNEQLADTVLELAGSIYERESVEPDGWVEVALSETAKWLSGGTPKTSEPSYWGGDIPWISAASLKTPWLYESERCVTSVGARNGTRLVPKGTVLFVVRGMSLTSEFRVGVAQREVAFGQDCKALIPHPDIDPASLFLAIKAQTANILAMVDLAGHGTGRLVTERVASLRVRLPQGRSAIEFAARVGALLDRAVAATHENRTLAELRDTLLPQLLSGKLRVRDAVRAVEEVV
ncbi:hypothetical protein C6376_06670 [Streptomyces sp. P3]|uniref:restriction endonuclease subunit S n=1 Tax=Streptomyces sp. P3 TaxID=2135430 RepID=UPI000D1B6054|nr:restriction endonuclease subunit S [Streptomyces sp. P3]AVV41175.1 hypothetical protein C6376_06670 [Streptomyces sp. P3]